jgi:outer membrane receptor protein involved in Fe transport
MRIELAVCAAVAVIATAAPAQAQADTRHYDISAQDLAAALRDFSQTSGREVLAPGELVAGRRSGAVRGEYGAARALAQLLEGTGLTAETVDGAFVLRPLGGWADRRQDGEIVVTGTRIRGAPVASPVVALDPQSIRDAGQATVAEALRTIPQNFGGGQNPGVGFNVPAASGVNVGGGASIDLRGLGSDATLTLLDGHRMPYSASRQSIDISAIPLAAVERIEVVADGASALYGSDAVAGVANIVLRRDFSGLEARARLGAATDGGAFSQLYDATAGTTWAGGGLLASYEFGRDAPVYARQRSYGSTSDPDLTFTPALRHHSVLAAGHQALGDMLELDFDGYYNWRASRSQYRSNASSRAENPARVETFALAPSLKLFIGTWQANLAGTYGEDRVHYTANTYSLAGALTASTTNIYRNSGWSLEANADGPLFALPGGSAKLALGAGYRGNRFVNFRGTGSSDNIDASQDSYFAFGELSLPLVSPGQRAALVERLEASAALRYERYPTVGSIATPKLGLIYAPLAVLTFKASWGKSFRAPTFYQRFQAQTVYLAPPRYFGGSGYPADATVFYVVGGNPALQPERATSWSATAQLEPAGAPGLRLEVSYFEVAYKDRIVTPLVYSSQGLTNPAYAQFVTPNPPPALQAATIAGAGDFVSLAGSVYDPTKVVAIVDNATVNAERQSVHGVDILGSYRAELAENQTLRLTVDASYLTSTQQLSALQPETTLAGTLFNPPHWRGRGTIAWQAGRFNLEAAVDYAGGVDDVRAAPANPVDAMTSFDLTARYRTPPGSGPFDGLDLIVSAVNLFNAKPDQIATSLPYDSPYDSTNYSPLGRMISLSVAKKW